MKKRPLSSSAACLLALGAGASAIAEPPFPADFNVGALDTALDIAILLSYWTN